MMSTKYGLMVREGKKMNNKYQKERCKNSSMHSALLFTNCIEEMCKITIQCVLTKKQHVGLDNVCITHSWKTRVFAYS